MHRLLWHRVVCLPIHHQQVLQAAQLVPPCFRLWSGRTSLHSDLVGCLRHRLPSALGGRRIHGSSPRFSQSLALAWSIGLDPGSRIRCYPSANIDTCAYVLCTHCLSSPWIHRDYLRTSLWPQCYRPWTCQSRHDQGSWGTGKRLVLGRFNVPDPHLCWILAVLPERAALQALSTTQCAPPSFIPRPYWTLCDDTYIHTHAYLI